MNKHVLALALMVVLAVPAARPVAAPDEGVSSRDGMVVCTSAPACDAGATILAKGGSAVDAAVATAFVVGATVSLNADGRALFGFTKPSITRP